MRPDIAGDSYHSFKQAIAFAVSENLPVVLGGDVFNAVTPDSMTVSVFKDSIEKLQKSVNTAVYVIQGQHDRSDPPWPLVTNAGVNYVHKKRFKINGVTAYGLDNMGIEDLNDALHEIPGDVEVLILHQMAKQAFDLSGVWNVDVDNIPSHVRLVLLGDLHRPIEFTNKHGATCIYPGSTYMCNISEPEEKSFLHITRSKTTSSGFAIKRIPLNTRRIIKKTVKTEEDVKAVIAALERDGENVVDSGIVETLKPIVIVEFFSDISQLDVKLLPVVKALDYHLWLKPIALRTDFDIVSPLMTQEEINLDDLIVRYADKGTLLNSFITDLVSGSDANNIFAQYRKTFDVAGAHADRVLGRG